MDGFWESGEGKQTGNKPLDSRLKLLECEPQMVSNREELKLTAASWNVLPPPNLSLNSINILDSMS